jgi:hypothetical protein
LTKEFLVTNEKRDLGKGTSISSINSIYGISERLSITFAIKKKIIPKDYVYPFSAEGYKITEYISQKICVVK